MLLKVQYAVYLSLIGALNVVYSPVNGVISCFRANLSSLQYHDIVSVFDGILTLSRRDILIFFLL